MSRKQRPAARTIFRVPIAGLVLATTAVLGACDDATGPEEPARVQVLLTDAPSDMLDSAHVWISQVYVTGAGAEEAETVPDPDPVEPEPGQPAPTAAQDGEPGRIFLYDDPASPQNYDLLELRDGVTADLTGEVEVDLTTYSGLRLVVDSARITLADGFTFEDGSRQAAFKVPSGSQSGIKVKLDDILDADAGKTLVVTVDFDVDRNFIVQMSQEVGQIRKVLFTPRLQEMGRAVQD